MIKGCIYWNEGKEFNIQTNDPVEELYRKLIDEIRVKYPNVHWGYLESCGPNAMTNCLKSTREGLDKIIVKHPGGYTSQTPHIIIGYLNNPNNYPKMRKVRADLDPAKIQGNRVPQFYPLAAREIFDIEAVMVWSKTFEDIATIVMEGYPVQACMVNPGHYIAFKAYNTERKILIYDDSWPERTGKGFNCEMAMSEFYYNIRNFFIIYKVK